MDFLKVNTKLIDEFRANAGKLTGYFATTPIVIITMTGAKSGRTLASPLAYSTDGDDLVVIASMGGAPNHPNWFHNLAANPTITVELPDESYEATAVLTEGDERRRLYDAQAEELPVFKEYEESATGHGREIPVFRLVRN